MAATTRYTELLGGRDALDTMRANAAHVAALTARWTPEQFERSYRPGKWTARQLLVHLAHTEMALGVRARMALSTPGYAAQKFDQDNWLARERLLGGRDAASAFVAMSTMNAGLFAALSPADRAVGMSHPEYGTITVDWIIHLLAGHQLHHIAQLEQTNP